MKKHTCALVLAAGFSVRYGSDKRFSGNEPLILRTLRSISNNFDCIYLVHRDSDEKLITLLESFPLHLIKAPSNNICLGTSIAVGFEHIRTTQIAYESCAVFLADMPFIKYETITQLKSIQDSKHIIRPSFDNTPGHPVFFGRDFFEELINIKEEDGASSVIKKNHTCLKMIEVQDCGAIQDIDYP